MICSGTQLSEGLCSSDLHVVKTGNLEEWWECLSFASIDAIFCNRAFGKC